MSANIKPLSLSLRDFICFSPEATENVNILKFASEDAWRKMHKWRHSFTANDAVHESPAELNMEERFMFICFVLLAEGEEL